MTAIVAIFFAITTGSLASLFLYECFTSPRFPLKVLRELSAPNQIRVAAAALVAVQILGCRILWPVAVAGFYPLNTGSVFTIHGLVHDYVLTEGWMVAVLLVGLIISSGRLLINGVVLARPMTFSDRESASR